MSTSERSPVIDASGRGRFWMRLVFLVCGLAFAVFELRHFADAIRRHLRSVRR